VLAGQAPPGDTVHPADGDVHGTLFIQGNAEFGELHPSPRLVAEAPPKVACPGAILLSVRAPVGAINVADASIGIGRGVAAIVPHAPYDARFLLYALRSAVPRLRASATGTTYEAIDASAIKALRVPDLGAERQRAIAGFLERECERIARLDRALAGLRVRLLAGHYERQGEQLLGGTPTIRLKHLIESITNGDWGADPGDAEIDVPCVRVTDFERERLALRSLGVARSYPRRKAASIRLREGDLILEKSGGGEKSPVGFVVRCGSRAEGLVCSNFVARMRAAPDVDSRWLVHLFAVLYARRMNQPFVKQVTGIQNLDVQAYLDTRVPDLSHEAQRQLAASAQRSLDKTLEARAVVLQTQVRLAEYRDALVAEAVSGQLDVGGVSEAQLDERLHAAAEGAGPTGTLTPAAR
jgi:type I restriction enzyme S subunit